MNRVPDFAAIYMRFGQETVAQLLPVLDKALKGPMAVVFAIVVWDTANHLHKLWRALRARSEQEE